jgi:hypothetical protein
VRHIRMIGLCLVAVMAVVAFAATAASAASPEWGQCYEKASGKYANSNCTTKAKKGAGTFEWRKGPEVKHKAFSGHNVGSGGVLSTDTYWCQGGNEETDLRRVTNKKCEESGNEVRQPLGVTKIECESETNHGEAKGTHEVADISVTFKGCKLFGSVACSNTSIEGEILVNLLKGSLGYIEKSTKAVGVLLEPVAKNGEFAKFDCSGVVGTVVGVGNDKEGAAYSPEKTGGYDGIISPITPVDTMSSEFTQVYTVNEKFENVPSKFEGKHIDLLEDTVFNEETPETNSSKYSPAGEEITNVNTSEEEVEIKA